MTQVPVHPVHPVHHQVQDVSDSVALAITKLLRWCADAVFGRRYAHRAVVLETVAAVPGMVAATLRHLRNLRRLRPQRDNATVAAMLAEAENERMHLLTFLEVARPTAFEKLMIVIAQGMFFNAFFLLYLLSPRTAHRLVGYFEEEAVTSYTRYLHEVDAGRTPNGPAPEIARSYWALPEDAKLRDVILAVRADEMKHRDVNHALADRFV